MNEIEFIRTADKLRTQLKKKSLDNSKFVDVLKNTKKIKTVRANSRERCLYTSVKKSFIDRVPLAQKKYIMIFYGFYTDSRFDFLKQEISDTIYRNFKLYKKYRRNLLESFIDEFFSVYDITDVKQFKNDKYKKYGFFRDLLKNEITLMCFIIIDYLFEFSEYIDDKNIVFWEKKKNRINNIKTLFKMDNKKVLNDIKKEINDRVKIRAGENLL